RDWSSDVCSSDLEVLHDARIASLKARGNENLTLVARGAETRKVGDATVDAYDDDFGREIDALGKGLAHAERLADDDDGTRPVTAALAGMREWKERLGAARVQDENGN